MTAVAVVLAGGRGTRSANPARAKLAQEVGGQSLMAWHLRLLATSEICEAIVVSGHLGDQVKALCEELPYQGIRLRLVQEERQQGTVAALRLAAESTDANEFLVILGDILMSFPVQPFLDAWRTSNANVAVVVHPSSHPEDSDAAFPAHDGSVLVVPKSEPREDVPNMSSAGVFAITRAGINAYSDCRDFGSDILPAAATRRDLLAFISSHYFRDTGTTERLAAAERDVALGAFARRGQLDARPGLLLDRDGVINPSEPEVYRFEDYRLAPGVATAIGEANRAGIPAVIVTNQPGLAKGFMTFDDHQRIRARMDHLLGAHGAFVDDYLFCPHHPESGFVGEVPELKHSCECRKPGIDLARRAAERHGLDLSRSAMVGDTDRDREFARTAGLRFIHVGEAPLAGGAEDSFPDAAAAIRHAIGVVTC